MIQQQIESFTRSLTNLASEYSDPSIVLQHIPVLKNNLMFQQNPEYIFYGVGGVFAALFALKKLKQRRKAAVKDVGLVMPTPYVGEADNAHTNETAPASFEKSALLDQESEFTSMIPDPVVTPDVQQQNEAPEQPAQPATRTPAQQLQDVSAISFNSRPALTPDEARTRVLVQSVLNEFGAGYMIMARTALSAILQPSADAVGAERAHGLRAIQDKFVDFGVFDRTGRCLLALDVSSALQEKAGIGQDKAIVQQAIAKANIPLAVISMQDTPADIHTKIAPHLSATARVPQNASLDTPRVPRAERPKRPVRPVRPAHAAAIAAE